MPKTRSGRHIEVRPSESSPYQRSLGNRQSRIGHQESREPSFTEWAGLSKADIDHLTKTFDEELVLLVEDTTAEEVYLRASSLPDTVDTSGSQAQWEEKGEPANDDLNGQQSPERRIGLIHGAEPLTTEEIVNRTQAQGPLHYAEAVATVELSTSEALRPAVPAIEALSPKLMDRKSSQEVALCGVQKQRTKLDRGRGRGLKDDPILLSDTEDDPNVLRHKVKNHNGDSCSIPSKKRSRRQPSKDRDMVQWSSLRFEEETIADFEEIWMKIQESWLELVDMSSEVEDAQLRVMLDAFQESIAPPYDDDKLAEGFASFLSEKWKPIAVRAEVPSISSLNSHLLQCVRQFSDVLDTFEEKGAVYDVITSYRGTAEDHP